MMFFNLDNLWWDICSGFMQIIDWLDQAFSFLIGAVPMTENGTGGQSENISNLFVAIFNGDNGGVSMTKLYLYIMGACVLLLGAFVAIGAIKSQFTKDATDSLAQIGEKTLF